MRKTLACLLIAALFLTGCSAPTAPLPETIPTAAQTETVPTVETETVETELPAEIKLPETTLPAPSVPADTAQIVQTGFPDTPAPTEQETPIPGDPDTSVEESNGTETPTPAEPAPAPSSGKDPKDYPVPTDNNVLLFRKKQLTVRMGYSLVPELLYFGSGTLTWYSSHPMGLTVDQNGRLTPIFEGNYTVYVTDGEYTASADVWAVYSVNPIDQSLRFEEGDLTLEAGRSVLLSATGVLGSVYYSSSDPTVATVSGKYLTAVAPGTAIIRAHCSGYEAAMVVTVTPATTQTVTLTLGQSELSLYDDESRQLSCSYNGEKLLRWETSDFDIARVDEKGLVTAVGEGSCYIYVTDGELSQRCLVTVSIMPGLLVEKLQFWSINGPLYDGVAKVAGDYIAFSVVAYPQNASQKTYVTISDSSVVKVTRQNVGGELGFRLDFRKAGTCILTICSGDDAVQDQYTITVLPDYGCNPGAGQLTPEEFVSCYNRVLQTNGMDTTSILPTGYLVLTLSPQELTWAMARREAEGLGHHWWSIGYRYMTLTFEGINEDGNYVFYERGA